jgi:hypothetical protein
MADEAGREGLFKVEIALIDALKVGNRDVTDCTKLI